MTNVTRFVSNALAFGVVLLVPALLSAAQGALTPQSGHLFEDSGQALGSSFNVSVALGDVDGDGDLDAFVPTIAGPDEVWLNDGEGLFSDSGQALGSSAGNDVALGDVDGDGDLDAFVANGGGVDAADRLWTNQGGAQGAAEGTFADSGQALGSAFSLAVALGDVDGDGDPDALVGGYGGAALWINQGGEQAGAVGQYEPGSQDFGDADVSDVALADLDGDGDHDALIGALQSGAADVWWNDGDGSFSQGPALAVNGDTVSAVAVGLLDTDVLPDVVLFGETSFVVHWNEGAQDFSDSLNYSSPNVQDVALGDVDRDGDVDLVVARWTGGYDTVWLNVGDSLARDFERDQALESSASRALALGDLDGDEDQDLFTATDAANQVWRNETVPNAPRSAEFVGSGQLLGSADTYGLALGDLNGDGAVDAFAANEGPNRVWLNNFCADFSSTNQRLGDNWSVDVALGDLDGDGDLDAFVLNAAVEGNEPAEVWLNGEGNDPPGTFSRSAQALGIHGGESLALGDVDGDGDLDAFITAATASYVYLNGEGGDPAGIFSRLSRISGGPFDRDVALGDADGDGDLDALIAGSGPFKYLQNLGGANFSAARQFGAEETWTNALALGDVDGDGALDVFRANGGLTPISDVWLNNLPFGFEDSGQQLAAANSQDVALGDVNGDGSPDAFLANGTPLSANRVWLNDGHGDFGDAGQALGDSFSRAVALRDLDGDGDLDAFVGNEGPNRVWLNDGRTPACQCVVEWLSATAAPSGSAPLAFFSRALQRAQQALDLLVFYGVRDEVLGDTPQGQRYRDLYYVHDAEIRELLASDADLRAEGLAALQAWQPNLGALLEGEGDATVITAQQVQAADSFLENLAAAASPSLQQAIAAERDRLPPPDEFVGLTMEQGRALTVGYAVYLPAVGR